MTTQIINEISTNAYPTVDESLRTNETEKQRKNRNVLDLVFTEVGFDQFFLDQEETPAKPHLRSRELGKPVVLHIDDDVDLVDAVMSRLQASGYRVASALDGVSGMQAALMYPADAIILDYDMPHGRGDTVIDLLKGNSKTKDIPVIVLTAVHQKGLKRRLLSKGADVFMTKPFEFAQLEETISELLN